MPVCGDNHSRGLEAVGLTADQRLVCFRPERPRLARDIAAVSGLQTDTKLVGIDYRPATGDLYGLGDQAGIYVVDPATAAASLVARANVALQGTSFGVDFNPAADRLRVVSDTGQNLRINVADGVTATDTSLTNPPNPATGVTGAMYTNNDADPDTGTTLFDVDSALDQVSIQSPPNNGTSWSPPASWAPTPVPTSPPTSTARSGTARPCPTRPSPPCRAPRARRSTAPTC